MPKSMSSTTLARWYVGLPSSRQSMTPWNRCGRSTAASRWRSALLLARTGASSQSTPSHLRSRMIASSPPGTARAGSVSSIRSSIQSPNARFATALSAFPTCRLPVGLGAKRTRTISGSQSTLAAVEADLLRWYAANGRDLPWRRTRDPYEILVSEVMLQQTQVERVVRLYLPGLRLWPTVEALAAAARGDVIRAWQGLGYNRRAVNLHRAAAIVSQSGWPDD